MSDIKCTNCNNEPHFVPKSLSENGDTVYPKDIIMHLYTLAWSCKKCGIKTYPTHEELDKMKEKDIELILERNKIFKDKNYKPALIIDGKIY